MLFIIFWIPILQISWLVFSCLDPIFQQIANNINLLIILNNDLKKAQNEGPNPSTSTN